MTDNLVLASLTSDHGTVISLRRVNSQSLHSVDTGALR